MYNNGIYYENFVVILIVNDRFGFGVLDALELVKNAKKWNVSVPTQLTCTVDVIKVTERYVFCDLFTRVDN
jgi:hypothetical protein